jgi:dTDP-4-dehydrorhamnose reductase
MKVLITGSGGQLGSCLIATAPKNITIVSLPKSDFDITDPASVETVIASEKPDILFNAAAYTAVDKAETDIYCARLVNATAVGHLAVTCRKYAVCLVHISTDFVFNGQTSHAYLPSDTPHPLNIYGQTKWEGEQAAGSDALIVRTSWVYAPTGHNFVRTMLRLMAEHDQVQVIADQIGTPTYAPGLAQALWTLAKQGASTIYHYTDSGVASWYDFAVAIQEEALELGLLPRAVPVVPINSNNYPAIAQRPAFSVLDKTLTWNALGGIAPHWRVNLRTMLNKVKLNG